MTDMPSVLIVVLILISIAGLGVGLVGFKRNVAPPGLTRAQRDSLVYVQKLLGNYHAAHLASPLTDAEIKEVLTLCKAELDRVLED